MILLILPSEYEFQILKILMPESLNGKVVIQTPGMGKLRTQACLYEMTMKYGKLDWVVLAGYAGSVDGKELPMGTLVEAMTFFEGDFDADEFEDDTAHRKSKKEVFPINKAFKRCHMITGDKFIKENPYSAYESHNSAVDMESFAVASFCLDKNIPFNVVKVISDVTGENSAALFKEKAVELADSMNEQITITLFEIEKRLNEKT